MHEINWHIRHERPEEYRTVEALTRDAFWNVYRPGCCEHYVLHRFRQDPAFVPELDLVLELNGTLIGQIIYVRTQLELDGGGQLPIMTFGPIGIAPAYQRQGFGKRLLDYSMEQAAALGVGALVIEGNIHFYGKCGFTPAKERGIRYADDPEAAYLLVKELQPGYLAGATGLFRDPEGYRVCERDPEEFARYEASFPAKEKRRLPGQLF